MNIKTTLKDIFDITGYVQNFLEDLGFSVIEESSKLSDSKYLTILNWGLTTGEKDKDSINIRISNHDLPVSYDGKYGYYDFDLKSKYDNRKGLQGDAVTYGDFLAWVADLTDKINRDTVADDISTILYDKKFLDWLYDRVDRKLSFKIMDLQEFKTIKQVQSYIDGYLYDNEIDIILNQYSKYIG